jgi:phosphate acetyltransferase
MSRSPTLQQIVDRAAERPRRLVFPEGSDPRIVEAARRLRREKIAEPILVGDPAALASSADGLDVEDPSMSPHREACLAAALEARKEKNGREDEEEIESLLAEPLYYAAAMVRAGLAAGSVAGAVHSTPQTLRAALRIIGRAEGTSLVSSFFLMALREPTAGGEGLLAFADCGMVPEPDPAQLAEIARQTADSYRLLAGREPRVALLSFSTHGSARHAAVSRVVQARERIARDAPDLVVDGDLQVDAALVPEIASAKAPGSAVAGRANVLIFPDLGAGNIGYKLVERLAGAQAVGPLLQGLRRPANDLSRGCAVDDIVVAAAVTAVQAG